MTFEKAQQSGKVERALRRRSAKAGEDEGKRAVRRRDKRCRFPLCGCKRFGLALHVSHSRHKGMGGNPKGDRSQPELMVLVCSARHRENRIAIDRGTVRWRALTAAGADGPIAWDIDAEALQPLGRLPSPEWSKVFLTQGWYEVGRELWPGRLAPIDSVQARVLAELAKMTV